MNQKNNQSAIRPKVVAMVLLISTLVFSANGFSQSAAERLDRLQAKFNSIKQSVMFAISSVSDHPDSLENGSLGTTLETAANKELTNLLTQLQHCLLYTSPSPRD